MHLFHDFESILLIVLAVVMAVQAWHMARLAQHLVRLTGARVIEEPRKITKPSDLNGPVGLGS